MQEVHTKLNPGSLWQKRLSAAEYLLTSKLDLYKPGRN